VKPWVDSRRMSQALTDQQQVQEDQYGFPYHYLDLVDEELRTFRSFFYVFTVEDVKDLLKPFSGQLILDAGCGDGRFCYEMRNENVRMIGIDYSERAIAFARAFNPHTTFFVQGLEDLNLPGSADQAVMLETLEHIIPAEIPSVLGHLQRCVKPGGTIVITVPSTYSPVSEKHYQHFTEGSLRACLEPFFAVKEVRGTHVGRRHAGLGYWVRRRIAKALFGLRKKSSLARKAVDAYIDYTREHIKSGDPEQCVGLVAVCSNSKKGE